MFNSPHIPILKLALRPFDFLSTFWTKGKKLNFLQPPDSDSLKKKNYIQIYILTIDILTNILSVKYANTINWSLDLFIECKIILPHSQYEKGQPGHQLNNYHPGWNKNIGEQIPLQNGHVRFWMASNDFEAIKPLLLPAK